MTTILVTGAQGFVGTHLLKSLLSSKNNVVALYQKKLSPTNLLNKQVKWLQCDLTNLKQVQKIIKRIKPNKTYHLAAQSSVPFSWQKPSETFKTNVMGTLHLVEALIANKKKSHLLIVGSGEVYGRNKKITEITPLKPENPYAASKAAQDIALTPYLNDAHLQVIRVRPFNHIGPGQDRRFAIPNFAYQIAAIEANKMPPVLHVGNLKAKRDFTDVRDVVRAYKLLMSRGKAGEVYNVCSGKTHSIQWMLNQLLSLTDKKIKLLVDPKLLRNKDILDISASGTKLKKSTGWSPQITLEKSLKDILTHFRREMHT